ncbi:hypothetical protein WNY51_00225 [Pseudocolwellia sp. AS88]|uniref:hypothetical protein n=1 Tax=Pseudocolwellia sp. AS88 TaxID=3063958 RepID=UPI0026EA3E41|nr:hypothetical protein [Pseudocolwellia sp. AS88]MDO7084765.1 hypothetical protein [Pseudocolwellia sp. AS88]
MNTHIIDHYAAQIPILPGEYLPAYLSRLRKMTSGVDPRRLMSFSGSAQLGKLHQLFPRVASCFAYRESAREYSGVLLKEHLGSRFWRGFVGEQAYREHIKCVKSRVKSKRSVFEGEEILDGLKPMKFCADCRVADIEKYGVPIWHATHQITSIYLCAVHSKPLLSFQLKLGETLLDYPVINDEVLSLGIEIKSDELRNWLNNQSRQLLSISSEDNRNRLKDVKSSMASAMGARVTTRNMHLDITYRLEWRKYLSDALTRLCPSAQNYALFSDKASLGLPQQLKLTVPVRHPLVFLLAMKFAEDATEFKAS